MAKMTMKQFEKSATDARLDKQKGAPKEGSPADRARDKAALAKLNGKKVGAGAARSKMKNC